MLTLISNPGPMTMARNTAIFQIKATDGSGNLFTAQGVGAEIVFGALSSRFTAGQTLTIEYTAPDGTTATVVFTGNDTPVTANHLPTGTFTGTDAEYWALVRTTIGGHPQVAPYFTAINDTTKITIIERTGDTAWVLVVTTSSAYTINALPAVADNTPDNYRVLFEVFVERTYKGGDYVLAASNEALPDADGMMYFDISSILAAMCRENRPEPVVPIYDTNEPLLADNLRRYYVRYTEISGNPATYEPWAVDEVRFCMDGGVAAAIWAEGNWFDGVDADSSLLTWMPDGRTVGPNDRLYLAWWNYTTGVKQVVLELITYDVETGTADATLFKYDTDPIEVDSYETLLIPIAASVLGISAASRYRYKVRVVDFTSDYEGGSPVYFSPSREYFIDRDYYWSERQIQYLNAFGVPEVWRCTGQYNKSLNVQRTIAQRALLPGYNAYATDTVQVSREFSQPFTYRTGYMRRADAEVLQELFLADGVYDVSMDGYVPLRVTTNATEITDTERQLHAYEFAVLPRLSMNNFSKRPVTNPSAQGWQEPDGTFWYDALLQPWTLP